MSLKTFRVHVKDCCDSGAITGNQDIKGGVISGSGDPVLPDDLATKGYVDRQGYFRLLSNAKIQFLSNEMYIESIVNFLWFDDRKISGKCVLTVTNHNSNVKVTICALPVGSVDMLDPLLEILSTEFTLASDGTVEIPFNNPGNTGLYVTFLVDTTGLNNVTNLIDNVIFVFE